MITKKTLLLGSIPVVIHDWSEGTVLGWKSMRVFSPGSYLPLFFHKIAEVDARFNILMQSLKTEQPLDAIELIETVCSPMRFKYWNGELVEPTITRVAMIDGKAVSANDSINEDWQQATIQNRNFMVINGGNKPEYHVMFNPDGCEMVSKFFPNGTNFFSVKKLRELL